MPRFSEKNWKRPRILKGKPNKFGWVVSHPDRFKLGKFTDIGYGVYIQSQEGVTLENHVQIGGDVKIYSVNTIDGTKGGIIIKRNAKVGAGTVILPNVVISENSKVGALSLVKEKTIIPPNEAWGGVPAKFIKAIKTIRD